MNKAFIWLPALLTIGVTLFKPVKEASKPKIEDKSVSLVIYKGSEYNSPVYNNSTAEVRIVVEKVNAKGQRTVVWDETRSAESLSEYPSIQNATSQNVIIPNVNKKKEHLEVVYTLTYNSKGTELQMQGGEVVSEDNSNVRIKI